MALTRPKYSQIYDTDWKQSVELATTADVGNLVLANVQPNSIDGVTVQTNYRILVKDQTSGAQNGIYLVRSAGTGSNGWWTRSLDAAQSSFVTAGLTVTVVSGDANGGKEFRLTTPDPITLGTTALTFINPFVASADPGGLNTQVQFNDASVLNGAAGLTFNKSSNVLTVGNNISTSTLTASGNIIAANLIVSTGSGQFSGFFNENITSSGVFVGNAGTGTPSPRIGFFNGNTTQNWQIDNFFGAFRWFTPGVTRMSLSNTGNLTVYGSILPSANVTYDLGSPTQRFRTGYFSANTIDLGGSQISVSAAGFSFVAGDTTTTLASNGAITSNTLTAPTVTITSTTQSTNNTTGALVVVGGMSVSKDVFLGANLTIGGNLFVNGNVTTIHANNLSINDSMIYLADDNPSDILDIGFVSAFTSAVRYQHTGFVRDATDGVWKLFANVVPEPITTVDFTNATYSNLQIGNLVTTGITASNITATGYFLGNGALLTGVVTGAAGAKFTTSDTPPSTPTINDEWYDTSTDILFQYQNTGTGGNVWVDTSSVALNTNIATIQGTTLSITGSGTVGGNLTVSGFMVGKSTQALYADLAENYTSDDQYQPGTVLVFGGVAEITQSTTSHDPTIAGVVSTNPAYLMNSGQIGVSVALTGRVPCWVRGPINKGDRVVSSDIPGVAECLNLSKYQPGCIIGKSLETIEHNEVKLIEVVVGRI